jgi:DNA-binding transcriptional regulator YiaG
MDQEYEFRVMRCGVLKPEVRITVMAETLQEAQEKAKAYLRRNEHVDKGGWRAARRAFTVDGAKLTALRIEAGLSMEEVAANLGCNKSNLSRWERGVVQPSERAILELVVLFKQCDFVKER